MNNSLPDVEHNTLSDYWVFALGLMIPLSIAALNVVAISGILFAFFSRIKTFQFRPQHAFFIAIVAVFFINEYAHDQLISRFGELLSTLFLFALVSQSDIFTNKSLHYLIIGLCLGLLVGFGIDQYLRPDYLLWAVSGIKYPNEAAYVAAVLAILLFTFKSPWKYAMIGLALLFIIMTESRSTFACLGIALVVYMLVQYHCRKMIMIGILLFLFVCIASIFLAFYTEHASLRDLMYAYPRIDLWVNGVHLTKMTHWLGSGETQFTVKELSDSPRLMGLILSYWNVTVLTNVANGVYSTIPFHSLFTHALVEHGILGYITLLILFVAPFVLYILSNTKKLTSDNVMSLAVGLAVWASFIVHCYFELGLYKPSAILIGMLAGAAGIFSPKAQKTKPQRPAPNPSHSSLSGPS